MCNKKSFHRGNTKRQTIFTAGKVQQIKRIIKFLMSVKSIGICWRWPWKNYSALGAKSSKEKKNY